MKIEIKDNLPRWAEDCFPQCCFEGSGYISSGGIGWDASTLYQAASDQGIKPYRRLLRDIDLSDSPWECQDFGAFVYHARRIMYANPDIPILLGPKGNIMDGYHRIAKAILEGRKHIQALRLHCLPEPDSTEQQGNT